MELISALGMIAGVVGPFIAVVLLLVFFLKRIFAWMDRRGWITYTGDTPTYGSLGSAFLHMQAMMQPGVEHVLEAKQEEEEKKEQDDSGGPDTAGAKT